MIATKKLIIAAIAIGGVVLLARRASASSTTACGEGSRFQKMTLAEASAKFGSYSSWPQIAEQIRKHGGMCVRAGSATDAGTRPMETNGGLDDPDAEDPVLITKPWQLL